MKALQCDRCHVVAEYGIQMGWKTLNTDPQLRGSKDVDLCPNCLELIENIIKFPKLKKRKSRRPELSAKLSMDTIKTVEQALEAIKDDGGKCKAVKMSDKILENIFKVDIDLKKKHRPVGKLFGMDIFVDETMPIDGIQMISTTGASVFVNAQYE